jgi:hypothetical protein
MFDTVKENLEKRGYRVSCFATAQEATAYLDAEIDQKVVAFGGSATLSEMGVYEALSKHNRVIWHARLPEGKSDEEVRMEAREAEIYLSSVNGLAETGEIVNIDGKCNRIASMLYGHKKVYLVIGKNKLVSDCDAALWRARNIAAPQNAKRLGVKTPCAVREDRCYDCKSPQRICHGLSVLWQKPTSGDVEVLLIDQELGF